MRVAFEPVWPGNPYHPELEKALRPLGVHVWCPGSLKSLYADYIAGKEKLDLVHVHTLPFFGLSPIGVARYVMFYLRLRWLQQRGVRVVWTVHDFKNHDSKHWRIEDFVNRNFSRRLDAMIVHGETAKQIIASEWGGQRCRRVHVIPHGNYMQSYRNDVNPAAARASLGLDESNLVFLFLGKIRPYKGVIEMVKAFRICGDSNLRLIVAGHPQNNAIKNEVERAIHGDSRIKFLPGHVEDNQVQVYMNASDVMVLPYARVFTSGAAVLAMSFGKPCIAPRLGCIPDVLDERGAVFFDPSVSGDLERAFREVLAGRQRLAEMGSYNLHRAAAWDWESIGRQTAAVYERCIANQAERVEQTPVVITR